MKQPRHYSAVPARMRLGRLVICTGMFLSGALLMGDTVINAGGGVSNAKKTGNGGGTLDYGQVTISGTAVYENNTVSGFSQGGAVYAGSVIQNEAVSFSGNRAESGSGGALYCRGNVKIAAGSSFSGNMASHNGGALCLDANDGEAPRTADIESGSTFTNNSAGKLGGAIYAAGKDAACQTELTLHSADSSRPISFSGNYRGRTVGTSSGGGANSITVMGNVSMVMQAEQNCLISMEDPIYSFAGYSATSSLRKTGPGTLGFGGGISRCHFPVSVEAGTVNLGATASLQGMTELDIAGGTRLGFTLPAEPSANAKWSAQGPVNLNGAAELHVTLPEMTDTKQGKTWKLVEGSALSMTGQPSVSYDPATAAPWQQAGSFSLHREETIGKSALVLSWTPIPSPYEKWKNDHFTDDTPEGQTAPDAIPAGDGITNLMKYATGLPPLQPCGSVTTLTVREVDGTPHLVLEWPVNPDATDVVFTVESSADLKKWDDEGTVTPTASRGEYQDRVAINHNAPERRFLRLKVTRE